ncbi:hypothetical protein [Aquimarina aquimarini]|uniref:hypothetical protein n=1 Tax=Aquimarina aquimarini TaxID=1191734 RepID=UPI000D56257A|nr:hypothetical protein [Aquimarina aquimarini]
MKIYISLCSICISLFSFGQEPSLQSIVIEWQELGAPLLLHEEEIKGKNYQLTEVDLNIDLRQQYLRKKDNSMFMMVKKKPKGGTLKHNITQIPKSKTSSFRVSGRAYNSNRTTRYNSSGLKNTAYRDARLFYRSYLYSGTNFEN